MKYIAQCPFCGEVNLDFDVRRDEFYCSDCETIFDREHLHVRVIDKKVIKMLKEDK